MAKLLIVDVNNGETRIAECNELEDYYRELSVDIIDITHVCVNGKWFDAIVDDEGLLKDNPRPSVVSKKGKPMLVGSVAFANHDAEGNTTSLSDEDIEHIKENISLCFVNYGDYHAIHPVVFNCDYGFDM